MNIKTFITSAACALMVMLLGKIYQHNRVIALSYEKQRLETTERKLRNEYNDCLIKFFSLVDDRRITQVSRQQYGFDRLRMSRLITLTNRQACDMYTTTTVISNTKGGVC